MNNKTTGLGRGLSSLIPNKKSRIIFDDEEVKPTPAVLNQGEQVLELPIEKILPNPHQPRENFDQESLAELVDSIREHGIIQPLIASPVTTESWQLIAGERRLRAAKILGLKTVPVIVRAIAKQNILEMALIENLQRQNLNALETAKAYQKLTDEFNLSQGEIAQKVGKSRSAVANTLRILITIPQVQAAIRQGQISEGHARVLAGLPPEDQQLLLEKMLNKKWNVREVEKAGREVVVRKHIRKVSFNPEVRAKEEELERLLGTKVEIKKFGGSGQIIIKFFSDEEFNEILNKIL